MRHSLLHDAIVATPQSQALAACVYDLTVASLTDFDDQSRPVKGDLHMLQSRGYHGAFIYICIYSTKIL